MEILDQLVEIVGDRVTGSFCERCCYSSDASQIEGSPEYVVRPISSLETSRILKLCSKMEIPVTARGAGTGLAGGASPVMGGLVLDMSSMNRILELDIRNFQAIVEPGVIPDKLNQALEPYGFFFPPDPGSSTICTIGGMISNNSSGMRCVKYGTTRNYVLNLQVVLADGRVMNTGSRVLKSSAGYDITRLFVGSEGTLGIVTQAGLKVLPLPRNRKLVIACFNNAEIAVQAVIRVFSSGIIPSACEILDKTTLKVLKRCHPNLTLPDYGDVIIFEVDGTENLTTEQSCLITDVCAPLAEGIQVACSPDEIDAVWEARKLVGAAISRLDPTKTRIYVGEDVGVPFKQMPDLIRKVQEISEDLALPLMKYGHIGDGNLHIALFIDVMDQKEWEKLSKAEEMIHRAALGLGGTVSSEHGIGLAKANYIRDQVGEVYLDVMRSIKKTLDPKGILNPGKLDLEYLE